METQICTNCCFASYIKNLISKIEMTHQYLCKTPTHINQFPMSVTTLYKELLKTHTTQKMWDEKSPTALIRPKASVGRIRKIRCDNLNLFVFRVLKEIWLSSRNNQSRVMQDALRVMHFALRTILTTYTYNKLNFIIYTNILTREY